MLCAAALLLVLITLPYILAEQSAGESLVFGGFLLNPLDGTSYLAKMYQGWRGDWLFTLPYTAEVGKGALIYPFYLLLGHLARWLGIPLLGIYHAARVLFAAIMSLAIFRFCLAYLSFGKGSRLAFLLTSFGSGLGWLALPFGGFTSDFWVAEAYPFLSAYVNPHFALGLALMLLLVAPIDTPTGKQSLRKSRIIDLLKFSLTSLVLALISPFAIVIALLIWACMLIWEVIQARLERSLAELQGYVERLAYIAVGGMPILVYQYLAVKIDPLLSGWMAQNVTPSPPVWDTIISLAPLLLLAPYGARVIFLNRNKAQRLFLVWILVALLILYVPFGLQRRFMMGIYIPVASLAALGVDRMILDGRRFWLRSLLLLLMVLPTNLLVLQAARHGIQTRDERLYLRRDEMDALAWIDANTLPDDIILASPETGLFIPAQTGRRVIYGHPFETVQADEQRERVLDFYRGTDMPSSQALVDSVDYIYYGPREKEIGWNGLMDDIGLAYQNPSVVIYITK